MKPKILFAPALLAALFVMFATQISYAIESGLLPRFPWPPMPERELNSWRFDSTAWQTNARTAPLALIDAQFAPSWSGYALRMSGTNSAIAGFAHTNLAGGTNLLGTGSFRFWFAPDWSSSSAAGTGPGVEAVLFETGAWSSENSYVRCSLQVDADGDTIRFVLHGAGGPETILSYFDLDDGNVAAPQTNSTPAVALYDTGSRLTMAVIRDGALWTCHHVGVTGTNGTYTSNDATGTNVDRSAAQWLKLSSDTNGNFSAITNGRIYDTSGTNPLWCYFPSLMVNGNGDMGMGFSGSRSNSFIGAYASYRTANGITPSVPFLIHAGNGLYGAAGWGDYSYTTLDPIDDCTFWSVQQYAEDDMVNDNRWGTWIFEIIPNSVNP